MEFDRKTILTEAVIKQSPRGGVRGGGEDDYIILPIIAVVSGDTTRPKVH